jgi:hypothetical protein
MKVLIRTNEPVLVGFACALLSDAGLQPIVLDQSMSAAEGSIGILPRRVVVTEADYPAARDVLREAGLAAELVASDEA